MSVSLYVKTPVFLTLILWSTLASAQSDFQKRDLSRPVRKSLKALEETEVFHIPFDENGWKTPEFSSFLELEKISSETEFILLTKHENPVVQCYAFYALLRNSQKSLAWKEVLRQNVCNNRRLKRQSGCIRRTTYVNQLMFELTSKNTGIPEREIMLRMGYPQSCSE